MKKSGAAVYWLLGLAVVAVSVLGYLLWKKTSEVSTAEDTGASTVREAITTYSTASENSAVAVSQDSLIAAAVAVLEE